MAKTKVDQKTQRALWARAAGRCQYRGCNCELVGELLSGKEDKMFGFVAHIVADSPNAREDIRPGPLFSRKIFQISCCSARNTIVSSMTKHPMIIRRNFSCG
ncbi:hypothetical protein SAMN05892877_12941 [Rhizobium subbaraonis]|uniref:Uncharacterized protein n=1 Tax=Rhizobium subbaraonis TaxID=908946 RepID=A0A285V0H9_9HYPH|nr:hypothetical protein [Rhizobium subbaraonis]SOC47417.1 hypothetical protein SAMN05892877_12941 [Rhizobium subbaraonis]